MARRCAAVKQSSVRTSRISGAHTENKTSSGGHPPSPPAPLPSAVYGACTLAGGKLGLTMGKPKKARRAVAPVALDEDEWVKGSNYEILAKRRRAAASAARRA